MEIDDEDVCRVCRSGDAPDNPLFHPCACTGSIKFVHQACLVQWLKHSRKEYCELCGRRFLFRPIYAEGTPVHLPAKEVIFGLMRTAGSSVLRMVPPVGVWAIYLPLLAANAFRSRYPPEGADGGRGDDKAEHIPILSDIIRLLTGCFYFQPYPDWSFPSVTNSISTGMLVMAFTVVCFCMLFIFLPLLELYGGDWLVVQGENNNGNIFQRLMRRVRRRVRRHRINVGDLALDPQPAANADAPAPAPAAGDDAVGVAAGAGDQPRAGPEDGDHVDDASDDEEVGDAEDPMDNGNDNDNEEIDENNAFDNGDDDDDVQEPARHAHNLARHVDNDAVPGVGEADAGDYAAVPDYEQLDNATVLPDAAVEQQRPAAVQPQPDELRQRRLHRFEQRSADEPQPASQSSRYDQAAAAADDDDDADAGRPGYALDSAEVTPDTGDAEDRSSSTQTATSALDVGLPLDEEGSHSAANRSPSPARSILVTGEASAALPALSGMESAAAEAFASPGGDDITFSDDDDDGADGIINESFRDDAGVDGGGSEALPAPVAAQVVPVPADAAEHDDDIVDDVIADDSDWEDMDSDDDDGHENIAGPIAVPALPVEVGFLDLIQEFELADVDEAEQGSDNEDDDDEEDDDDDLDEDDDLDDGDFDEADDDADPFAVNPAPGGAGAQGDGIIDNNVMGFLERDQGARGAAVEGDDINVNAHRIFRLLGFEGGLDFLLVALLFYLFITISLDAVAAPTKIGQYIIEQFNYTRTVRAMWLEGTVPLTLGYVPICVVTFICNAASRWLGFRHFTWFFGAAYLSCKVIILLLVELVIFPQLCGFWLHICCLGLMGFTADDMNKNYQTASTAFCFVHWILGMEFLYFFANFVIVSRKVLRPGVLWFFRNLNDPNFNPMQEIMTSPVLIQVRHFLTSSVFLGTCILLITWVPVKILKYAMPSFLPYALTPVDGHKERLDPSIVYIDVVFLHFMLGVVFDNRHTRWMLHGLVYGWSHLAARLLGLQAYLIGRQQHLADAVEPGAAAADAAAAALNALADQLDEQQELQELQEEDDVVVGDDVAPVEQNAGQHDAEPDQAVPAPPAAAVEPPAAAEPVPAGAAPNRRRGQLDGQPEAFRQIHELARMEDVFREHEDYERPTYFHLRVLALVAFFIASSISLSLFLLTVPAVLGRLLMGLLLPGRLFEGYTVAIGFLALWLTSKVMYTGTVTAFVGYADFRHLWSRRNREKVANCVVYCCLTFVVIPALIGMASALTLMPVIVSANQTPVYPFYYLMVFICGFAITNLCLTFLLFTHADIVEGAIREHRNMFFHLLQIFATSEYARRRVRQAVQALLYYICIPYTLTFLPLQILGISREIQILVFTHIYFCLCTSVMLVVVTAISGHAVYTFFLTQHSNMKKEKYLNGFQLMNYHPAPVVRPDMQQ